MVDSSNDTRQELVLFHIGAQEFCVDIMMIREIRGWIPETRLPHSPASVRGVINLRGIVLPIIDLGVCLGLSTGTPTVRHAVIVAEVGRRIVGLLVDAVSDIITVPVDSIQPAPEMAFAEQRSALQGVLSFDDRMVSLLALETLPLPDRMAA